MNRPTEVCQLLVGHLSFAEPRNHGLAGLRVGLATPVFLHQLESCVPLRRYDKFYEQVEMGLTGEAPSSPKGK